MLDFSYVLLIDRQADSILLSGDYICSISARHVFKIRRKCVVLN